MRTRRLGALTALSLSVCAMAALAAGPPAAADTGPERTDVVVRGLPGVEDGRGVVRLRPRLAGDVALCTGSLRLKVVDLAADQVVSDVERPVARQRRFPLRLDDGRYRLAGTYQLGERDPCVGSRDVRRLRVRG